MHATRNGEHPDLPRVARSYAASRGGAVRSRSTQGSGAPRRSRQRSGDRGLHQLDDPFCTTGLHSWSAYDTGHMSPSSRFAASWKPRVAARHADPRTTMRYDRARKNLDRHPYPCALYAAEADDAVFIYLPVHAPKSGFPPLAAVAVGSMAAARSNCLNSAVRASAVRCRRGCRKSYAGPLVRRLLPRHRPHQARSRI